MSSTPRLTPVRLTVLMCVAETLTMTGFAAYTTLLPVLQREWGLSNSEAGLIGGIYYAGYVAATPVLTSLTDRVDSRYVYVAACLVSIAGAAGFALFAQGLATALVFCASLRPDAVALAGAATLAALINLMGPLSSVTGNELAIRFGRSRVIFTAMFLSGVLSCAIGWLAGLPLAAVFFVMCLHYALMLGDSAALTSGLVAATPPAMRGATMAVYSFLGFSGAILAPLVFGLVLDLAGGNQSRAAWGWAFASIGIFGALSPLARWLYLRRKSETSY